LGSLSRSSDIGGVNTIRVFPPNGNNTVLTFANSGTFTLRAGTRNVIRFEATTGVLGSTTGAQIKFVGTPFVTSSNSGGSLLANTATGATVGWATVSDSYGVNFATYNGTGTSGRGIISIANPDSGVTITTLADTLTGFDSTRNTQLNVSASTTLTASAAISTPTLRISPGGNGSTLAMGGNNLSASAIMLAGTRSFAITGTGVVGTGTRYFYVNSSGATLSIEGQITTGTSPVVFAGPGIVALTGSTLQNNGTAGNNYRVTIAGGVLRANNTQMGFDTDRGVINLFGGVLEITSGTNGNGTSADFRRSLGTSAGNVNWGAGNADQGSGGFSAFGAAASVNIGGLATPAPLQWNQANFVADGNALRFGSLYSNAVLNWLNPLQLDNGAGYQARVIEVTEGGIVLNKTVIKGVISGAANADLIKAGFGTLELAADNTYLGNTLVHQGRLLVNGNQSAATGQVLVADGGSLGGIGTIGGATTVKGSLSPGNGLALGKSEAGEISFSDNLTFDPNSRFLWNVNYAAGDEGTRGINYDAVNVGGALTGSNDAVFAIEVPTYDGFGNAFWGDKRTWTDIFLDGSSNPLDWADSFGAFEYFGTYGYIDPADVSVWGSFKISGSSLIWTPVPEPSSAIAGLLLAAGLFRRRRSA